MVKAFVVAGLGFGDEGKGSMVDYLCRVHNPKWVVRYNGGPQAAHNVVLPGGHHHTFAQFGSGTFQGCATYLSEYMVVDPPSMFKEAQYLENAGVQNPLSQIMVHPQCLVILPWQSMMNQIRELSRNENPHGTCGMGIYETKLDANNGLWLTAREIKSVTERDLFLKMDAIKQNKLLQADKLLAKLFTTDERLYKITDLYDKMKALNVWDIIHYYRSWGECVKTGDYYTVTNTTPDGSSIVFEGAQGVLLDEIWGFGYHKTWSNCTFTNALAIMKKWGPVRNDIECIGVIRPYHTRHGAGPFPTEVRNVGSLDGIDVKTEHNGLNQWQGYFRYGYFDALMYRYALYAVSEQINYLAVTHCDEVNSGWKYCSEYNRNGGGNSITVIKRDEIDSKFHQHYTPTITRFGAFGKEVMEEAFNILSDGKARVKYMSFGPTYNDKHDVIGKVQ